MKLSVFFLIILTCSLIYSNAQQDPVASRIILIGGAGELQNEKNPGIEKVKSLFNLNDGKTNIIFLGDNIYEYGLPDITAKNFEAKRKILDEQVSLVKGTNAKAWFLPGDYDWKKGKEGGWEQLKNQQHLQ